MSWSASAHANNYVLEERYDGGGWGVAWNGSATSTSITVDASGTYQFQVAACAAGGCSGFTTSGDVVAKPGVVARRGRTPSPSLSLRAPH